MTLVYIIILSRAIFIHPFSTTFTCTLQLLPRQLTVLIKIVLECTKTHRTLVTRYFFLLKLTQVVELHIL